MKTLEELGFEKSWDGKFVVRFQDALLSLELWSHGEVKARSRDDEAVQFDQEVYRAIENEMKKRGWWQ